MFPVRCTSCGKVLGNLQEKVVNLLSEQLFEQRNWLVVFEKLNLKTDCCQQELMTYAPFDEWQFYYDMINEKKPLNFSSNKRIHYDDDDNNNHYNSNYDSNINTNVVVKKKILNNSNSTPITNTTQKNDDNVQNYYENIKKNTRIYLAR